MTTCKLHYRKFDQKVNLSGLTQIFSTLPNPAIIGANQAKKQTDRFSYWAAQPKDIFEFSHTQQNPLKKLDTILKQYNIKDQPENIPHAAFTGGWIGYFSYDLARFLENIPNTKPCDLPLIRLCFYDKIICFDHKKDICYLFVLELETDKTTPVEKLDWLEDFFFKADTIACPSFASADLNYKSQAGLNPNMTKQHYLSAVDKIIDLIHNGQVYQINLSQKFDCPFEAKPVDLFHWQNKFNPSGHSAYIDAGNFQIISASPELFLSIQDRQITTRPIKGTRPRFTGPEFAAQNHQNRADLLTCEKEKAELNMITDLMRNDLGRICVAGSITVPDLCAIEEHPTLYHAVSTVKGWLRPDVTFPDILKATFPGGSITGAPKIAAMRFIEQIEPTPREIYTGSIALLGLNGNVSLNIAIRTIIISKSTASVQVGGGIVYDSIAENEWQETLDKAKALLAGIDRVNKNAEGKI